MKKILLLCAVPLLLCSCGATSSGLTKSQQYPEMYAEKPAAILIMPPINRSTKVEAKELFYSSLIVPLSQRGYYVMPPLLTLEILREESANDAEMFTESSMKPVGELFGVDAVLFTTIHEWTKTTIASQVKVVVEYKLKSARTDEIIFNRTGTVVYSPQTNSGNIFADLLSDMVITAMTKEIDLGRKCNVEVLGDLPAGAYSPAFQQDGNDGAGPSTFSVTLK